MQKKKIQHKKKRKLAKDEMSQHNFRMSRHNFRMSRYNIRMSKQKLKVTSKAMSQQATIRRIKTKLISRWK